MTNNNNSKILSFMENKSKNNTLSLLHSYWTQGVQGITSVNII